MESNHEIIITAREYRRLLQKEIELDLVRTYATMEKGYLSFDRMAKLFGWKDMEEETDEES